MAIVLAWVVGVPVGILSALRQNTSLDYVARFFTVLFLAIPNFWLGAMIVLGLLLWRDYAPPLGVINLWDDPVQNLQIVWGPALVLVAFVRRFPVGCVGALVLVLVALLAIAAPLVSRYDPTHVQLRERKALPSWSHPLGTDYEGRDILTRIIYRGRVSLAVSILAVVLGGDKRLHRGEV